MGYSGFGLECTIDGVNSSISHVPGAEGTGTPSLEMLTCSTPTACDGVLRISGLNEGVGVEVLNRGEEWCGGDAVELGVGDGCRCCREIEVGR